MQIYFRRFLLVLSAILMLAAGLAEDAHAQRKRRSKGRARQDMARIKAPSIKGKSPAHKASSKKKKSAAAASTARRNARTYPRIGQQFVPAKVPSVVDEPMDSLNDAETNIVEVDEEIKMDCTWVKVTEYYSLWDSRRVNPYGVDKATFHDTIDVLLYDSTIGSFWHPAVAETFPTSRFGPRGGRFHYGCDLELDIGDTIRSVWDGIVRITSFDARGYGYYVLVRHYNGLETLYGHMSSIQTEVGTLVKAGQPIGLGGNTGRSSGPHCHFEVRYQGNAINPEHIFDFPAAQIRSDHFLLTPEQFGYTSRKARKVFYHRVRAGDTLHSIASKYGLSIATLARINGLSTHAKLRAGRRIKVKT